MNPDRTVWFVVPAGIDDVGLVSGGNVYDRELRDGLRCAGWDVRMVEAADAGGVSNALAGRARADLLLIDGLVAAWAPHSVESAARTATVVVLAHMVLAGFAGATPEVLDGERRALASAARVIATSQWTAGELVRRGLVHPGRVVVARPGSRDSLGTPSAGFDPAGDNDLLSVGVVAPHKGHDLLLDALDLIDRDDWTCTIAGSQSVDPRFAAEVASAASRFDGRVSMPGVLEGAALDRAYRRASVLVAPSRSEGFGIAIADARRGGLPIIATAVDGIPEAAAGGGAVLVPGDDPRALADALGRWMADPDLRARLRSEAQLGRARAPRWADTVARVEDALVTA